MSILSRQDELPLTREQLLPAAPLTDRDKAVAWLHEMYKRKRNPRKSLMRQADAVYESRDKIISNVVLACRPGGHSPALEDAKAKFMREDRIDRRKQQ